MSRTVDIPLPKPFPGFGPGALDFFRDLDAHQTRDWFLANKSRYEHEVREPMSRLVIALTLALAGHNVPLTGDPKTALFRINRDIRFAKDKRPYKTTAGAVLTRDGAKHSQGLLYVHVGLDGLFTALGFYGPEPDELHALRTGIVAHRERWRGVEAKLKKAKLALSREWTAARLPRGFDAAEVGDLADVVRLKSFVVTRPLTTAEIASPTLVETIARFAAAGRPLLDFGWSALAERPRS